MASNKKYWTSAAELKDGSIVEKLSKAEFLEEIPTDEFLGDKETLESSSTSRRDFLKYVGFTTAAASLAACEGPVIKTIPYVVKPNDINPGVADYYATAMADGYDFANILVKVRDGRPIKINPNKEAGANNGTNARVQASVLSLYDSNRLKGSLNGGKTSDYASFDKAVVAKLNQVKASGAKIVFLTRTMASPSTDKLLAEFKANYPTTEHVVYDAVSESAALDAFETMYGSRALPNYDFAKADVIVSVGADFLGDWQGGGYDKGYATNRVPKHGKMSKHIQIETNMSLTGANADKRYALKPSEQKFALINLYNAITGKSLPSKATPQDAGIKDAAKQLKAAGSKAVVVTGIQDKNAQLIALAINKYLNSVAVDTTNTNNKRKGNDTKVAQLIKEMNAGQVGAIIINQANPVYTLANSTDFVAGLKKVKLSVAFATTPNETTKHVQFVNATPHYLESWGDVEIVKGQYSLMQPTINKLFDTRQFQDALLSWNENSTSYYNYMKNYWSTGILGGSSWNTALQNGTFKKSINQEAISDVITEVTEETLNTTVDLSAAASALAKAKTNAIELAVYTKVGLGDGQQANNPWLQELPDPITRTSWDNYLLVSRADAEAMSLTNWTVDNGAMNGDLVDVTVGGKTIKNVPVYIQPGQAKGSVAIALGYGRTEGMQKEMMTGVNAYPVANLIGADVKITKVSGEHKFACVQLQHTMMGRDEITNETSLHDYINKPREEWNPVPKFSLDHQEVTIAEASLYDEFGDKVGPHFNLSIDLATCTGCAACVIACHAENNVPVVGKKEIRVSRDMHWLRIDRYYTSEMTEEKGKELDIVGSGDYFEAQTHPEDQPEVNFQPVMCQHCNNAPCENVCPVAATSHGRQGQNQMAYNRCVGTRYCANNCPYRVRRFNWFKYANNSEFNFNMNNELGRMVLNPDVVVRSRGVMEKCSMCIQMTQATILKAKKEGRPVAVGEYETACTNACNTGAMSFGDVNNHEEKVAELQEDTRTFKLLEFIGTKPNVLYQLKVRNS
jgi:molybdopterin-containing oxidoreductase family iron-sulfur binding subunit